MPRDLAAGPHSPPGLISGDEALGWLDQRCTGSSDVRACVRVSDVRGGCRVIRAYARGERLLGVVNMIINH